MDNHWQLLPKTKQRSSRELNHHFVVTRLAFNPIYLSPITSKGYDPHHPPDNNYTKPLHRAGTLFTFNS